MSTTYIPRPGATSRVGHLIADELTVAGASVTNTSVLLGAGEAVDLNGVADALVLDADADTTISAPTDDQIDIEIAGADDFRFTANTFTALSGSTIATNTIAETTAASGVTVDGALIKDGTVPTQQIVTLASGDGAIAVTQGAVVITKASVAVLTLAAPTAGTDDGKVLLIVASTAHAHTVTNAAPGFNAPASAATSDVATFDGEKGSNLELIAYNGAWYVINLLGVTLG
jgi:hypothetical protein